MASVFTRSLGYEPGIQLNPTIDSSEGFATDTVEEQTMAGVMRLPRGYIDRAFRVNKGNVATITGKPEAVRKNHLNIAHTQLVEAVKKGARTCLVSRLVGENAVIKWILVNKAAQANDEGLYELEFTLSNEQPTTGFLFAIKHKQCFSDGIKIAVSANEVEADDGSLQDATYITLTIMDKDENQLDSFTASIDLESLDDDGYPNDMASVIEKYSADDYEMLIANDAVIGKDTNAYGFNEIGIQREAVSSLLQAFDEGDVESFTADQYAAAIEKLEKSETDFIYISSFQSESVSLCSQLGDLAYAKNIQYGLDVPGSFTPKQAIAWLKQLGLKTHLIYALWTPITCFDPSGVSGRLMLGTSAYRCALSCARNAVTNAKGFSNKQYPIAGRNYPLARTGMKQIYTPNKFELSDLAKAGITPVIYQTYQSGSSYVFNDAITLSGKSTSALNLVSSAEIAITLERHICRIAHEFLKFKPMQEAIKDTRKYAGELLEDAETSGWLVKSEELEGNSWMLSVQASEQKPFDTLVIKTKMRPEGCARQIMITNEVTR